jgi:SAM-dependent methyltransferase
MTDLSQHNEEIQENLQHWQAKPVLREAYATFYAEIAARLQGVPPGRLVEIGAGIGNLKTVLPECLATDLFPNPWLDQVENTYALSFADQSVAGVILFDVFHHLQHPGAAFAEIHRVLVPGGRLILFEPAMGLLGRLALGLFHHEPLGLRHAIEWDAPPDFNPAAHAYYAAQGNAWRIFGRGLHRDQLQDWRVQPPVYFPALPYLLTGGFRGPQLCPDWARPLVRGLDHVLGLAPRLFASRMLVLLEKPSASAQ